MDLSTIVTALIGGGVTLVGCLISNSRILAVLEERIDRLRADVEKHNKVIERTFKLEAQVEGLADRIERIESE